MRPFVPPLQIPDSAPSGGHIGTLPEDFYVEEIPAYEPSGEGEHVYLHVEKRGKNTSDVARTLAELSGVSARDIGYAGMKDKQAVTRQWFSLPPGANLADLREQPREDFSVLQISRHKNKLRTGHLIGNRFRITLRDVPTGGLERARAIVEQLRTEGLANYFGPQRFGWEGRNLEQALRWLVSEQASTQPEGPGGGRSRDRRSRRKGSRGPDPKLLSSVLQSEIFNRYLARRLSLPGILRGEVVRLQGTGSHFVVEDPDQELPRFLSGDLLLTGPMIGPKGLQAQADARALELEVTQELGLTEQQLTALGRAAPGARRDLRLFPASLEVEACAPGDENALLVRFELPAGAFATQVIRELTHSAWDAPRESAAS